MRKPSSDSVRLGRVVVFTAAHGLSATCIACGKVSLGLGTVVSEPIPSQISPSLRTDDVSGPPSGMTPYLPRDASLLSGESTDFPFLPAPLTPRQIIEKLVAESVEGSPTGEPVAVAREGSFDVHQDFSRSRASPRVLDSMRGCQYRMTSYDEDTSSSEFHPACGIHLHDPRLLEYVGAPESARLLSRSPEYWLHHMVRWCARRRCRLHCSSNMTRA